MINACKSLFYCLSLISIPCSAQWNDSFQDGDFRNSPRWFGDTSHFEVNAGGQLHLNAPAITAKSYLVTSSGITSSAEWNFKVHLDFNPSSTNYAKVYLMSDMSALDSSLNGYYLKIGGTEDNIALYKQTGLTGTSLMTGRSGMLNAATNQLSVRVTRTSSGEWTVSCDTTGQTNYLALGNVVDSTYWFTAWFGVQCIYTSTRSTRFYFDDFEVKGKTSNDTIPPRVGMFTIVNDSALHLNFSEAIKTEELHNLSNFKTTPAIIKTIDVADGRNIRVLFSGILPCKDPVSMHVSGLHDMAGNQIKDTTFSVSYCPGEIFDIIITEIMADPDPPVLLQNTEYLELYNKSGITLNLENWTLQVGNSIKKFPAFEMLPESFLIVCAGGKCSQFPNKPCLDILSSSELNNSGEYVAIRNAKNELIHWIEYSDSWYGDDLKKNGGWSLEMMDVENPCTGKENWLASSDTWGGTPGTKNSVSKAVTDTRIFDWDMLDLLNDSTVRIYFTKSFNPHTLTKGLFQLDNGQGAPTSISVDQLQYRYIDLIFSKPFSALTQYHLEVSATIESCSGQSIGKELNFTFRLPEPLTVGDIIINEIMFDPAGEAPEYVELYNNSEKYIRSHDLKLSYRTADGKYENWFQPGSGSFLITPGYFLVLTKYKDSFGEYYPVPDLRCVIASVSFPVLSDEAGCFAIMDKSLQTMDEFCYTKKHHFPLLADPSGVSLERIRYNEPAADPTNWHSASSTSGFATPGERNSQYLESIDTGNEITLEYEIFSPDNDGYKDMATLHYNLDQPGYVATIIVFDALGRCVKILSNNKPLGTTGIFTWDGIDENGKLSQTGIYLILSELHHPSGKVKQVRNTCVLGGRRE